MCWNRDDAGAAARSLEGAIWWGVAAAIDGWANTASRDNRNRTRITDRELVEALQGGAAWTGKQTYDFAREYSVHRTYINYDRQGQREAKCDALARHLQAVYKSVDLTQCADPAAALGKLWVEAMAGTERIMEEYNGERRLASRLPSFCMKSLWYYQPEHATMWDRYAVVALNSVMNTHHNHDIAGEHAAVAFLRDFDVLHTQWHEKIDEAIAAQAPILGTAYPYSRRVLDKALWLIGKSLDTTKTGKGVRKCDTVADDFIALLRDWKPALRQKTEERFGLA